MRILSFNIQSSLLTKITDIIIRSIEIIKEIIIIRKRSIHFLLNNLFIFLRIHSLNHLIISFLSRLDNKFIKIRIRIIRMNLKNLTLRHIFLIIRGINKISVFRQRLLQAYPHRANRRLAGKTRRTFSAWLIHKLARVRVYNILTMITTLSKKFYSINPIHNYCPTRIVPNEVNKETIAEIIADQILFFFSVVAILNRFRQIIQFIKLLLKSLRFIF
jgi:hypothetical protein